jgi:HEAT repeat protein
MSSSIPSSNDPSQLQNGESYARSGSISSDELLPPVEPPSAGFIIQLFVIPAVIVAAVVLLWFAIESLARSGEQDPDKIVSDLKSNNQARFQRANELADMLRLPQRYPKLKVSHELAGKLAAYLDELVEEGDDSDAAIAMRYFLATALGEFHVDDGLPVLVKTALNDPERDVRRRAINAIAVLTDAMAKLKPPRPIVSEELVEALVQLADDQDELIRSETAFALGVAASPTKADPQLAAAPPTPDPRLATALEELADDTYTDARFNAAAGLARAGSPRAAAAIAEMLDPSSIESSLSGETRMNDQVTEAALNARKAYKRNTIITSALTSIDRLLQSSLPAENFVVLQQAMEGFLAAAPKMEEPVPLPDELVQAVSRKLETVKARAAK